MIDLSGYGLIIFDKDGTLIDFNAMWGGWIEDLGRRLEGATGLPVSQALYDAMDYDAANGRAYAGGRLAVTPMAQLRGLAGRVLQGQGLSPKTVEDALAAAWRIPDPASTARPLADLPRLFQSLRAVGLEIAVVTSDDHAPTQASLDSLGLAGLVDVVIGADDGAALKPAPDMMLAACKLAGVPPEKTIVVGDAVHDLQMARAAGAGLTVGVTSGVSPAALLAPFADVILGNAGELTTA